MSRQNSSQLRKAAKSEDMPFKTTVPSPEGPHRRRAVQDRRQGAGSPLANRGFSMTRVQESPWGTSTRLKYIAHEHMRARRKRQSKNLLLFILLVLGLASSAFYGAVMVKEVALDLVQKVEQKIDYRGWIEKVSTTKKTKEVRAVKSKRKKVQKTKRKNRKKSRNARSKARKTRKIARK